MRLTKPLSVSPLPWTPPWLCLGRRIGPGIWSAWSPTWKHRYICESGWIGTWVIRVAEVERGGPHRLVGLLPWHVLECLCKMLLLWDTRWAWTDRSPSTTRPIAWEQRILSSRNRTRLCEIPVRSPSSRVLKPCLPVSSASTLSWYWVIRFDGAHGVSRRRPCVFMNWGSKRRVYPFFEPPDHPSAGPYLFAHAGQENLKSPSYRPVFFRPPQLTYMKCKRRWR